MVDRDARRTARPEHRGPLQTGTVASTDAVVGGGGTIAPVTLSMRWTARTRLAVGAIGLASALGALAVAQGPGSVTTYAGRSAVAAGLVLFVGLALIVGGLIAISTNPTRLLGGLAVLVGFTWFGPVWEGWHGGPPLVRTLGMLVSGLTFAFLFHLIFEYPGGRPKPRIDRVLIITVYVEVVVVAIGRALFRDPFFDPYCWSNCTDNVFLVRSVPSLARGIVLTDRWFTLAAVSVVTGLCAWRVATGSRSARRILLPILVPTIVLAGAIWGRAIAPERTPVEAPADPVFFAIFATGAVGVLLIALAVGWAVARMRLRRRAVMGTVADLGEMPAPGSLEAAMARAVGDPELRIAYWLPESERFVDARGTTVAEPTSRAGRSVARLVREDRRVAVVSHAATLPELQREIGTAVRLGLENERLQAGVLAHLEELRASRARIVETGDAERRRLERTSTTERSSASSLSRTTSGSHSPRRRPRAMRRRRRCWARPSMRRRRRWPSCGSSPTGSTRRSWSRPAWRQRSRPSRTPRSCRSRSATVKSRGTRQRSRQPCISSWQRRSRTRLAGVRRS